MSSTDKVLERAGRWFLHSGIQEPGGGVARYYRTDSQQNAHVSTEITGYAVSALFFLHQRSGQQEYLNAGLRAAHFLTREAWDARLSTFPFELSRAGGRTYFFDTGIIIRGLLTAWRVSRDTEFRDTAIAAGRAMLADFVSGASIHPILTLPDKRALDYEPRWSASPGCYQLKSAMAWFDLFETTGEMEFLRGYESALEQAMANDHDFLPGDANREKVMDRLHAYLYFLEGLLPVLNRSECAQAFHAGLDRVAAYLREISPVFARSDVYAQLLRARLCGENLAAIPFDHAAAAQEAERAAGFQVESSDPRLSGGFGFGRKSGVDMPFANPVSTAFCLQALTLWADRKNNALQVRRQALI